MRSSRRGRWSAVGPLTSPMSYAPFTCEPLFTAAEAAATPQVILLHSATKRYAVPGLRLGCLTACRRLSDRIRAQRMPWSVNALAIEAGEYFLEYTPLLQPSIEELLVHLAKRKESENAS